MKAFFAKILAFIESMLKDPSGDVSSKRVGALGCFLAAFIIAIVFLLIKKSLDGATGPIASFCGSGTAILTTQAITKT